MKNFKNLLKVSTAFSVVGLVVFGGRALTTAFPIACLSVLLGLVIGVFFIVMWILCDIVGWLE